MKTDIRYRANKPRRDPWWVLVLIVGACTLGVAGFFFALIYFG